MTRAHTPQDGPRPAPQAGALARAAAEGDAARVEELLAAGARADEPLPNGETGLARAAALGYEDVARLLIGAGADVNARRADGFTPLTLATFFGHAGVVRLLLEHGADASARSQLGTTAQAWAEARGFAEISELIKTVRPAGNGKKAVADPPSSSPSSAGGPPAPGNTPAGGAGLNVPSAGETAADHPAASREGGKRGEIPEADLRAAEVSLVFGQKSGVSSRADKAGVAEEFFGEDATPRAAPVVTLGGGQGRGAAGRPPASDEVELFASFRPPSGPRQWRGAVGLALLAVVCASAVYAAWVVTRQKAAPVVGPPQGQNAQPLGPPAPDPAAQPTPGATGPDLQSPLPTAGANPPGMISPSAPAGGAIYVLPPTVYSGEPAPLPPSLSPEEVSPAPTPTPRRKSDTPRPAAADSAETADPRGAERQGDGTRAEREEGRQTPSSVTPPRPAPTTGASPAASPTPSRKVIQWPPAP